MNFKKKTPRSESYLAYIRTLPCAVKGCKEVSEPHHTSTGGVGMKGSDFDCIPLCRIHHQSYHRVGKVTFYARYQIDLLRVILKCQRGYKEEGR